MFIEFLMEGNKLTEKKEEKKKLKKIAWGITGSGDRLQQTFDVMKKIREDYEDLVDIRVYVSKAGDQVLKYYKLSQDLVEIFDKVWVETNANALFLLVRCKRGSSSFC